MPLLVFPTNGYYTGSHLVPANLKPKFMWEAASQGVAPLSYELQLDWHCNLDSAVRTPLAFDHQKGTG
ncbi:MAG: hypothetical protein HY903_22250 [Deltaproteobacteria bacterium]|nr:hypothetical protein [Deltaproteobacteria bacterium]